MWGSIQLSSDGKKDISSSNIFTGEKNILQSSELPNITGIFLLSTTGSLLPRFVLLKGQKATLFAL